MSMTVEQLMKPRYEVIADYPESDFNIGDIIEMEGKSDWFTGESDWYTEFCGGKNGKKAMRSIVYFKPFPHIFRPLNWWEKRQPEDMPEYVSADSFSHNLVGVFKVIQWKYDAGKLQYGKCEDGKLLLLPIKGLYNPPKLFIPATEQEYNNRQNQ